MRGPPVVAPLPKLASAFEATTSPKMEFGTDEPFFVLADAEDVLEQKKEFRAKFLESIGGETAMAELRDELAKHDPQSRAAQLMRDQLAFDERILESADRAIAAQEFTVESLQMVVEDLQRERRELVEVRRHTNRVLDQRQLRINREARRATEAEALRSASEAAALRDDQDTIEARVVLDNAA